DLFGMGMIQAFDLLQDRLVRCLPRVPVSSEWTDAGADRVGDLVLGDHADNVRGAPAAAVFYDDGHLCIVARHALNDIEHDVALAGDGEISLRYIAQKNAAIGLLDAAPEAG